MLIKEIIITLLKEIKIISWKEIIIPLLKEIKITLLKEIMISIQSIIKELTTDIPQLQIIEFIHKILEFNFKRVNKSK